MTGQHARFPMALAGAHPTPGIAVTSADISKAALPERVAKLNEAHMEVVSNVTALQLRKARSHVKRVRGSDDEDTPPLPEVGSLVFMDKPGKGMSVEGSYRLVKLEEGTARLRDGSGKEWKVNEGD
jgi:hypothetical protein